jgi:D-sedoheptulose 7-phosphate isomerase
MSYAETYLQEATKIICGIETSKIDQMVDLLKKVRSNGGRVFFLGVGGGAANASHATNDFRKIAGIEAYAVTDNVSELTARTNDEGWEAVFIEWLKGSKLKPEDMVFVFSVGGGNSEKNISKNIVKALDYAKSVGSSICGIVGRDGGYTAKMADACIIVPTVNSGTLTPHTESFQAVLWHLLVSHPEIAAHEMKWESIR